MNWADVFIALVMIYSILVALNEWRISNGK